MSAAALVAHIQSAHTQKRSPDGPRSYGIIGPAAVFGDPDRPFDTHLTLAQRSI